MYKSIILVTSFFFCFSWKMTVAEHGNNANLSKSTSESIEASKTINNNNNIDPKTFEYSGTIGSDKIYLSFSYEGDNDQSFKETVLKKGLEIKIFGHYNYLKSKALSKLEGEINPASKTITLRKVEYGELEEIFVGKYTDNYNEIQGTWKETDGGKSSFSLEKFTDNPKTLKAYAEILGRLTKDANEEQIQISGLTTDSKNISFKSIKGANLQYSLSNNFFYGTTEEEKADYGYTYKLDVKSMDFRDSDLFIIKTYKCYQSYEIIDEDDDYSQPKTQLVEKNQVWMLINNSLENIYVYDKSEDNNFDYKAYYSRYELFVLDKKQNIVWRQDNRYNRRMTLK